MGITSMSAFFDRLPLNRLKMYTRATAPDGCVVYIPVASRDEKIAKAWQTLLQKELNSRQPDYTPPQTPQPKRAA
jgi:hypothetical protein